MFCCLAQLTFGCSGLSKNAEKSILMFRKVWCFMTDLNRTLCLTPRIELRAPKDTMSEHVWIWFDHTVCDLSTSAFQRLASDTFTSSEGRTVIDLSGLKYGRIDFWSNPALACDADDDDFRMLSVACFPPAVESPDGVVWTGVPAIDECLELLRKTCAQSGVFDPDLYPNNDSIRKNASER